MSTLTPRRSADPATPSPRVGPLGRLARITFRRRGRTVLAWLGVLVVAVLLSMSLGGDFTADYSAPGSDSKEAQTLLEDRFPSQAGDTVDVVVRADGGIAGQEQAVQDLLAELGTVEHVVAVSDPFQDPAGISQDGTTLVAHLRLDVENPVDMPIADSEQMLEIADAASTDGFQVGLGGQSIVQAEQGEIGSEGIGLAAAAIILLITFGSRRRSRAADHGRRRRPGGQQHPDHRRHLLRRRPRLVDLARHHDGHRHRHRLHAADGHPLPGVAGGRARPRGGHGRDPRHRRALRDGRRHHRGDQHARPVRDGPVVHARRRRRDHPRRPGRDGRQHHALPRAAGLPRQARRQVAPPHRAWAHGRGGRGRPRRAVARLAGLEPAGRPPPDRRGPRRRPRPAGAGAPLPRRPVRLPRRRQQPRGDQQPPGLRHAGRRLRRGHERPAAPRRRGAAGVLRRGARPDRRRRRRDPWRRRGRPGLAQPRGRHRRDHRRPDDRPSGLRDRRPRHHLARRRAAPGHRGHGSDRPRRAASRRRRSTAPTTSPSGCRSSSVAWCCSRCCC